MNNEERLQAALGELARAREALEAGEIGVKEALGERENALKARENRVEAAVNVTVTLLKNARQVYTTLVTRDVLSDRTILHEIREEIDKIDEKITQLRRL